MQQAEFAASGSLAGRRRSGPVVPAGVLTFLRNAQGSKFLSECVREQDCYQTLGSLSAANGTPVTPHEFRALFMARNARSLFGQLVRRGRLMAGSLPPEPAPLDSRLWERISGMDFSEVEAQLVTGQAWTAERAANTLKRYRRFLYLKITMPDDHASPTRAIDDFWHQHIINTRRYGSDCYQLAGRFLHHTFLDMTDAEEVQRAHSIRLHTQVLYEDLFVEPYEETVGAALLARWPNG